MAIWHVRHLNAVSCMILFGYMGFFRFLAETPDTLSGCQSLSGLMCLIGFTFYQTETAFGRCASFS